MIAKILLGLLFITVMVLGSGVLTNVVEVWANRFKKKTVFFASVLMALVLCVPELVIILASVIEGRPILALGSVVGANMANVGLVLGLTVLVVGVIPVVGEFLVIDFWTMTALALLPFLLMGDGVLGRVDGLILIFGYLLYLNFVIKSEKHTIKQAKAEKRYVGKKVDLAKNTVTSLVSIIFSFLILFVSALFLLRTVTDLEIGVGLSDYGLGLILIALMTTVPEFLIGFVMGEQKKPVVLLEKLLGSVITNSTLLLGILAILSPFEVGDSLGMGVSWLFLIFLFGLFWLFTKTKRKLNRWEGLVILGIYLMFLGISLLMRV